MRKLVMGFSVAQICPERINKSILQNKLGFLEPDYRSNQMNTDKYTNDISDLITSLIMPFKNYHILFYSCNQYKPSRS